MKQCSGKLGNGKILLKLICGILICSCIGYLGEQYLNKQKEIVKIFKFLSNEDALSVLFFVHSTNCSESFTADYVARNTGLKEERVTEILDEFCSVGACHWVTAHLTEGDVRVYGCLGDGLVLSLISLAFERMCGRQSYEYNFNGRCKMIGGK